MISESVKMEYWELVEKTLAMLGEGPELARELREDIKKMTAFQQELFYHAEPLDIAGDLCGITRWSQQDIERYLDLQGQCANIDARSSELLEGHP